MSESKDGGSGSQKGLPVEVGNKEAGIGDSQARTADKDVAVATPAESDAPQYPSSLRRAVITFGLALGTLLIAIDNTIIGVATPKITAVFNALPQVGWFGSAYLLTITSFQPCFGKLYSVVNAKLAYIAFIIVFEVGSILCAAAPSATVFILGRAVAGIGAAGLFQGAFQIVTLSVELEKRPLHLGLVVSVFGVASCFGPILGGVFTDHATWRWCFWINLPVGAVSLGLVILFLKRDQSRPVSRTTFSWSYFWTQMDPIGAATIIASVCCLLLALQWGGTTYSWRSSQIIGLFAGFGSLLLVFFLIQWRLEERATIPLQLLAQRTVFFGSLYVMFAQMVNFANAFYIPYYFQAVQGVSATRSGIQYIPFAISQIVAVVVTAAVVTKTGHYGLSLVKASQQRSKNADLTDQQYCFTILGAAICATGTGLLTRLQIETSTIQWAAWLVVSGLGLGMGMQLPYTALQAVLPEEKVPIGNAVALFFSQIGGAIAVSVGQSIFINGIIEEVPKYTSSVSPAQIIGFGALNLSELITDQSVLRAVRQAYTVAIDHTLLYSLAAACVAIPLGAAMEIKNVKQVAEQRKAMKAESEKWYGKDLGATQGR